MDFYVYLHKKKTTGEVFYVGKGCRDRAWVFNNRNPFWEAVYEKHGCTVEIVADNLQEWYALELETLLIDYYGRRNTGDGTLVNLKAGGDGVSGEASPRLDREIYTFHNLKTGEQFIGTRAQFNKKFPEVQLNGIMAGFSKTSKNWAVEGFLTKDEVLASTFGYAGKYGKRVDNKVYTFVQLLTGKTFNFTRHELVEFDKNLVGVNISDLISGNRRTLKGWAMSETLDKFSIEHLLNPLKGERCARADKNTYEFKNLKTGEIFEGTRSEFKQVYNIDVRTLFVNCKTAFSVKDWCLAEKEAEATRTSNRDRNVYSLQHKSGEVFKGTRMEFKEKFGHTFDTLVQPKNPNKSCKGWRLVN